VMSRDVTICLARSVDPSSFDQLVFIPYHVRS
jgi:hypothetical protein